MKAGNQSAQRITGDKDEFMKAVLGLPDAAIDRLLRTGAALLRLKRAEEGGDLAEIRHAEALFVSTAVTVAAERGDPTEDEARAEAEAHLVRRRANRAPAPNGEAAPC